MSTVKVDLGSRSYPIRIRSGCLSDIVSMLQERKTVDQIAVISDETVSSIYGEKLLSILKDGKLSASLYIVPDGESSKSLNTSNTLYTRLIEDGFHRDGLILALGGGVIGDLAGFIAATYLRGVRFAQIPTSLLAQVDSSVGGKVGINHALGKNLIGNFYQPEFVLIDPLVLKTLDQREIHAGLGEILKYGLIGGNPFFAFLENLMDQLLTLGDLDLVGEMIKTCCQMKADVVAQDEREGGWRRVLNLGHTVGHALESATGFNYFRHGEAVVHGLDWASWISVKKGYFKEENYQRVRRLLQCIPIPKISENISTENLLKAIQSDKKQTSQGIHLVLINDIGQPRIEKIPGLTEEDIQPWLAQKLGS